MQEDKVFYFLQPGSEQAIGLMRVLGEISSCEVVAVLVRGEKRTRALRRYYKKIIVVENYLDIPGKWIVPFGAASTGEMLKRSDIHLVDVVMRQSALSVYDKNKFLEFCKINDLPFPKTFTSIEQINSQNYPLFYKQRYEKGGGVRGVAFSEADLPEKSREDLIYQELINTKGTYGVGFIANDGIVEVSFCHFESKSFPVSGGSAIEIEAYSNQRLLDLTSKYVKLSSYTGWGLAEFKWCEKRQDFVFMEINAKLWASCEFSFRNEPAFLNKIFGAEREREVIERMIFLNRAFLAGGATGVKHWFGRRSAKKVVYPGLVRAITLGLMPVGLKNTIKKVLGR